MQVLSERCMLNVKLFAIYVACHHSGYDQLKFLTQ